MAWEQKEGSGSLFQADQKGNERAPKWRGDILLNGVTYELAGWVKTTKAGDKFLSLSGKVKEERQKAPEREPDVPTLSSDDFDVPF